MKRLTIGHLQFAVVGLVFFVDWRMPEKGNRWRLIIGPRPLWLPLGTPRHSRSALGLEVAWYPKGMEP